VVGVFLVAVFVSQSWPLRDHREFGGSLGMVERVAATGGEEKAVYLFTAPDDSQPVEAGRVLAGPVFMIFDRVTAFLPADVEPADICAYQRRFPEHTVYLMTSVPGVPTPLDSLPLEPAGPVSASLPYWEESVDERPDDALSLDLELHPWRIDTARACGG
jgi:hypothetical protein